MTANGMQSGIVLKENERYALIRTNNRKHMILSKEYLRKHNKDYE